MDAKYKEYALLFKALSDPNRLMIADMLSHGELCACFILDKFNITQPTLSHHMKTLCESGLVNGRKEGKWMYYSLNDEAILSFRAFLEAVTTTKQNGIFNEAICVCGSVCDGVCDSVSDSVCDSAFGSVCCEEV